MSLQKQAAEELGVDERTVKHDLGHVLLELERKQEQQIKATLEPKSKSVSMSPEEQEQALQLLRAPKLIERIVADFDRIGFIGESTNKLVAYLAVTSRKLEDPLAVVVQSSSAAGKSSLMDAVLGFVPEEDRAAFSAMTGQSLYYMGERDLAHRILAVAEEAGAKKSSYALKLLQSEGEISIASTAKDPATGRLMTQEYRVQGPVMLFLTTTSIDIDPELENRCIVLTVDEGREQTRAIHALQRKGQMLEGLLARKEREAVVKLHQNAQRLLRSIPIVNPFASELSFFDGQARSRRDHAKYLNLIKAITLLHQHQRAVKSVEHLGHKIEYIEVEQADVDLANKLGAEVLFEESDELPPQTRKLLESIRRLVAKIASDTESRPGDVKLTQRVIRQHAGLSATPTKRHLRRLVELEYLAVVRGGPRKQTFYVCDPDWAPFAGDRARPGLTLGSPASSPHPAKDSEGFERLGSPEHEARPGRRPKKASYAQAVK